MIFRRKQSGPPVTVGTRWREVWSAGEVVLHQFSQAELDAVTLDPQALPAAERGPFLQAVPPVPGAAAEAPGSAAACGAAAPDAAAADAAARPAPGGAALSRAITELELQGFVRPGPPAAPGGPILDEFAGWSAAADGDQATPAPVALAGDLAIITRIRSQPTWIAEVSVSPEPTRASPQDASWQLAARLYAPYRLPVGLVERPAGPDGQLPPFVLLRDDRSLLALVSWCGADVSAPSAADTDTTGPAARVPTAEVACRFGRLALLRVAHPEGQQVLLRTLIVASGHGGTHWLLEGEQWERALSATVDGIGERVSAMLTPPASAGTAAGPAAPDASRSGQ